MQHILLPKTAISPLAQFHVGSWWLFMWIETKAAVELSARGLLRRESEIYTVCT